MDDNDLQNECQSSRMNSTIFDAPNVSQTSSSSASEPSKNNHDNLSAIKYDKDISSVCNGPIIGKARALVDYTPSPYDRDALRFKVFYFKQNNVLCYLRAIL